MSPDAPDGGGPPVFGRARLGPVTLKNRIIKAATFEGATPKGAVTDELIAFHRRVADGGAAMTTVAYLAVSPEGRTDRHCALLGEDILPGLRRLTDEVHGAGAAVSAQIGHAGPVANSRSNRTTSLAPSRRMGASGAMTRAASPGDIARITEDYRRGASVAVDAGFDCIEVHLGHDYLLSAFLSPRLNRRTDQWGGSLAARARFPLQVVAAVREAVGDRAAVTAKLNMSDGVPGGFWLEESVEFARMLEAQGALDAIELTGGSSLSNPMYLFRGEAPMTEFAATLPAPLRLGFRV
ncbi:MAG: NADH:flavin oxidoreductase, partial [Acidimicrobiales bacterium]